MAGDLKPGIDTFEFYPLPRAISKFQYGTRPETKPNERKKKNNSFMSPHKKIKIREGKKIGQMKEHNQGVFCNIEILTSFSKKIRIISRIYNRGPPKKCSGREEKN
jgi:hypothetical protein